MQGFKEFFYLIEMEGGLPYHLSGNEPDHGIKASKLPTNWRSSQAPITGPSLSEKAVKQIVKIILSAVLMPVMAARDAAKTLYNMSIGNNPLEAAKYVVQLLPSAAVFSIGTLMGLGPSQAQLVTFLASPLIWHAYREAYDLLSPEKKQAASPQQSVRDRRNRLNNMPPTGESYQPTRNNSLAILTS